MLSPRLRSAECSAAITHIVESRRHWFPRLPLQATIRTHTARTPSTKSGGKPNIIRLSQHRYAQSAASATRCNCLHLGLHTSNSHLRKKVPTCPHLLALGMAHMNVYHTLQPKILRLCGDAGASHVCRRSDVPSAQWLHAWCLPVRTRSRSSVSVSRRPRPRSSPCGRALAVQLVRSVQVRNAFCRNASYCHQHM